MKYRIKYLIEIGEFGADDIYEIDKYPINDNYEIDIEIDDITFLEKAFYCKVIFGGKNI